MDAKKTSMKTNVLHQLRYYEQIAAKLFNRTHLEEWGEVVSGLCNLRRELGECEIKKIA